MSYIDVEKALESINLIAEKDGKSFDTVRYCDKCGERYEPICSLKHICKKQNSYPVEQEKENDNG